MKKIIQLLTLLSTIFVNAQIEIINLPNGFNGQFILKQENNIFYVAGSLGSEIRFFRYNIIDNSAIEYSNQTSIPIFQMSSLTIYNKYNFLHNGKFYQNYNNIILEFNDTNNTVNEAFSYYTGVVPIKHNNIFVCFNEIRNLTTNILQNVSIGGIDYFLAEFVSFNNDIIAFAHTGSGIYDKIVKVNSNDGVLTVLKTAPIGFHFAPLSNPVNHRQSIADQYLMYKIMNNSNSLNFNLASLNLNNSGDYNDNIANLSSSDFNNVRYFNFGNFLYVQNLIDNNTKIIDGNNLNLINIPVFQGNSNAVVNADFSWGNGYGGDSFFKMNNKIYGLRKPNNDDIVLYETDGTETGTILKNSATILDANLIFPSGTRIYNNEAYFFNGVSLDKIYKFDGTNFYKVYELFANGYGSANSEAYYHNNYILFQNSSGLVRLNLNMVSPELINLSTLSNQSHAIQKPTFSPNPTQSQITFSEEISNLEVFDISGKKVKFFQNTNTTFDASDLEKGIYLLKGKTKEEVNFTEKLIIK